MTGLLGGAFNPPHNGHLALARAAQEHFDLDELAVLVAERPGHKRVHLDAETRCWGGWRGSTHQGVVLLG